MRRVLCFAALLVAFHANAQGFRRAVEPWAFDLPRDHRSHPDFALEWWYLTGHLATKDGRHLGYQATFFRDALVPPAERAARTSPLAAGEILLWHGAVTDLDANTYAYDEDVARAAAGWASASSERLDVRVRDRSLRQVAPDRWELRAIAAGWTLELDYVLRSPPVIHGDPPGLSVKGPEPGQASHYVSRPQLATTGFVTPPGGTRVPVSGVSWFDQEFGSGQLASRQSGWDWFSASFDDGSALMLYLLREKDGAISPTSSGTWVRSDGTSEHLVLGDVSIHQTSWWTSPHTAATYPAAWLLEIPRLGLLLRIDPNVADQERGTGAAATPAYWEGSCSFIGFRDSAPLQGVGYVELVGYAGDVLLK